MMYHWLLKSSRRLILVVRRVRERLDVGVLFENADIEKRNLGRKTQALVLELSDSNHRRQFH
ncbi:ABC transporter G family member 39 [Iris pallida]|uniref:ABC transporter G family member 39 n=1 Tax=Iris pallida TaxID=29817 RepID=A0AAX6EXR1_IRIPA|nr:ABC transporter G family member 39 [Iris pallida]